MLLLPCCLGLLLGANRPDPSNRVMVEAAGNFLAALNAEQKSKAVLPFDIEERMNWHYIPRARKGLPFKEMTAAQQQLAHALLSSGLSQRGYLKATTIMSLEEILREIEQGRGPVRDSLLYYFTIFGEPSGSKTWGWRVEGHHVSLNFTLVDGQKIADTPAFFGSNPGEVKNGPRAGLRVLAREEDLARELLRSLNEEQRKMAVLSATAPHDIVTAASRKAGIQEDKGLPSTRMKKEQLDLLVRLIEEYASNMPEDLAQARVQRVRKAGLNKLVFAWMGGQERGELHYYRVQGPTFLIELDNTQDNGNHIHSVWRDFNGDWGEDLLARHYQTSAHHGESH